MTKTYNDALEWAAKWIEDTLRAGPETNERTIEFGTNMAMTLRAAKLSRADLPRATADDAVYRAIEGALNSYRMRHTREAPDLEHGLSLADRLTPDDDKDVARGREELDDLIDYVCGSVGDLLRTTPRATGETTVEAALAELQQMFPNQDYEVKFGNWESPVTIVTWREMTSKTFYGANLADCMAQVRAATRTEGEGEKA